MKLTRWIGLLLAMFVMPVLAYEPFGTGLHTTQLLASRNVEVGEVRIFNTQKELRIQLNVVEGWRIKDVQIHADPLLFPATNKRGIPIPDLFPFKAEYDWNALADHHFLDIDFEQDFDFSWGEPWEDHRFPYIAIRATVIKINHRGRPTYAEAAWAVGNPFDSKSWGWWLQYEVAHPRRGHFIDSPVAGLNVESDTFNGKTDESGGFDFFPGERVKLSIGTFSIGNPLADHKISPLDVFESADTADTRVLNMARLLQSLDVDASPKDGILIDDVTVDCFTLAMLGQGLTEIDFTDSAQVELLIQGTITACDGLVPLVSVSAEDAKENLDRSLDSTMFRKNISRTPDLTSSKSKLNIMGVWFPALRANDEPASYTDDNGAVLYGVPYYDENGDFIRSSPIAKPIVLAYTDGVVETGYEDIFAAISRDDGNTFKRKNLSRAADKSSFELANGQPYYGQSKKPVFHVKGNNILISWTSKFCTGGKPTYAITTCDDPDTEEIEVADPETGLCRITCTGDGDNEVCEPDYPYDDPYYEEDIWGVGGPQRSVDYTDQGFPEVGEVPYSCVWVERGTVVTQAMIDKGGFWADKVLGDIVWFKPERLTSGRRDANQVFMGGADGAGFAIAWQEDPEGLRPGDAAGPGPGWGGATTNHKTDIWYSYITMPNFAKIDMNFVSGGDPQHEDPDLIGRPKALVPMSLPIRLSDNDTVNTDNLMVELGADGYPVEDADGNWIPITNEEAESDDADGTHAYGYKVPGLCESFYEFVNNDGATKRVCITADNRLLDGNTGASRPNLFLQTYTKPDGSKSAWAIMAYEETKGAGIGPPDHDPVDGGEEDGEQQNGDEPVPEEGKNALYLSFDFQNPPLVDDATNLNFPEMDIDGNLVYLREVSLDADGNTVYGELILDHDGLPILAYENARRPRFILQGKSAMGASKTPLLVLYKQGVEGHGRPSDIMMRRIKVTGTGNPYSPNYLVCTATQVADNGQEVCVDGAMNMSSVSPTEVTDSQGEPTSDDPYGAIKVVSWEQTPENFNDPSWLNPYDDARAHRGQIRGDLVTMGYSYTPNWAAARNGNDKYDFFVRRSFDGGVNWTTDPAGLGTSHCNTWTDPLTKEKTEECKDYDPGEFEQAHNLSQLQNAKSSVIEPRIVCPGGTIKINGVWTGIAEDKQDKNVCYVAYGTSTNPKKDPVTGEQEAPAPEDLYYSYTQDRGETFVEVEWDVNPDSSGTNPGETILRWDFMAKGDAEQGEVQLRMTPDGSRFYGSWLEEGLDGSDISFRRIMPPTFPANVAPTP